MDTQEEWDETIIYEVLDFDWEVRMDWDFFYDPSHQEQYPGHMNARIIARLDNGEYLSFQPNGDNRVDLDEVSGSDYIGIIGHPPHENPSYEKLRKHAQRIYNIELSKVLYVHLRNIKLEKEDW